MELIIKIAWRNIMRHKGKSIIIGIILFLGSLIMTLGNGVISGMEKGLEKNIVDGFTGDVVIVPEKQEVDNVLLTLMGKSIEPINNYIDIKKTLSNQDFIDDFIPVGKNMAMVLNEEEGQPGFAILLGVDYKKYKKMFPDNIKKIEGRFLKDNERGALVPTGARKQIYDMSGLWFIPFGELFNEENFKRETKEEDTKGLAVKDSMVFLGYNEKNSSMDIRLDVTGVVKFNALDGIFGHFILMDIESYRECLGYFSASSKVEISEEKKEMLNMGNTSLDDMFGNDPVMVTGLTGEIEEEIKINTEKFNAIEENVDIEEGAYNLVFVKFKDGISKKEGLDKINKILKDEKLSARAVTWKAAFGAVGSMTTIIKGALFGFVMLLFIVAIIIIVNTLSMTALERTSEIGMMRAIGARKSFISSMFLGETAMLSFVFGGIGIGVGIILVNVISMLNITSNNDLVQLLYGGDTFNPIMSSNDILITLFQLALVTFIAVIYPVKVAKSITPLDAISRD